MNHIDRLYMAALYDYHYIKKNILDSKNLSMYVSMPIETNANGSGITDSLPWPDITTQIQHLMAFTEKSLKMLLAIEQPKKPPREIRNYGHNIQAIVNDLQLNIRGSLSQDGQSMLDQISHINFADIRYLDSSSGKSKMFMYSPFLAEALSLELLKIVSNARRKLYSSGTYTTQAQVSVKQAKLRPGEIPVRISLKMMKEILSNEKITNSERSLLETHYQPFHSYYRLGNPSGDIEVELAKLFRKYCPGIQYRDSFEFTFS